MRNFLFFIFGLIILFVGAVIIVPGLIPSEVYQDKIETQLSKELGRDVTIGGDVEVKSFPFIRARTSNVTVKNYAGFSSNHFIKIQALEAKVKLLPLLSKRVEITGFNLNKPEIYLERKANGKTNWTDPNADLVTSENDGEAEPFQRDGRFTNFDPQIAAFTLAQGRVTYSDAVKDEVIELSNISGSLSLPSLSSPLRIDTKLQYQNTPMEVDLQLDNLRAFLNGREVPFTARVISDFADIDVDGRFLHSEDLDFSVTVNSDISDFDAIQSLTPQTLPYIELLNSLKLDGAVTYEDKQISLSDAVIDANGTGLSAQYKGRLEMKETPVLDGDITINLSNFLSLQPYLPETAPSLSFLDRVQGSAKLVSAGEGFEVKGITAKLYGEGLQADYKGQASYINKAISANGRVTSKIDDVYKIAKAADMATPYASLLRKLSVNGDITVNGTAIDISKMTAQASEGVVNGTYEGLFAFNDRPVLGGTFDVSIDDFSNVAQRLALETPYGASVKKITARGTVKTENDEIIISDLSASTRDGLLNSDYVGTARYSLEQDNSFALKGDLSGEITNIRTLAALSGTTLPSATDVGNIFTTASLKGALNGTPQSLNLSNVSLAFDDIKGTGQLNISLQNETPFVDATMALMGLDLRPYMASYSAQNPTGDIQPWAEETLNTAPLKLVNGDFMLSTPNIITDRLRLGQSDIKATLVNGRLTADMPKLSLYGGDGRVNLVFDTAKTVPEFSLDVVMDKLEGNSFLGAVSGFTQVTGTAETKISIKGSGTSQAAIMKSLIGDGRFLLSDGEIKGIDIVKFTTGLDDAFKTKSLPEGIGSNQVTSFKALESLFAINNGVVSVNDFDLVASGLAATGTGKVDLGNQTLDFRLRPRLTGESAGNIAGYGIPLQFSGGFGSARAGLDTQFLGDILTAKAKAEAAKRIQGQVKGPLGDILGSVIGGTSTPEQPIGENTGTAPAPADTPAESQRTPEDEVLNAIGSLFGQSSKTPSEEDKTKKKSDEKDKKEDTRSDLEKALGSILGD